MEPGDLAGRFGGRVHPRVVLHTGASTAISLGYLRFGEDPTAFAADWDRWPVSVTWSRDGDALLVTADEGGRCPVFRVGDGGVEPLTTDDYATDVTTAPGGVVAHGARMRRRRSRYASTETAPS